MSVLLKKEQVANLNKIKTELDGYVNTQFGVLEQFADREFVVSALYDNSVDGDIPVTTDAASGVELDMTLPIGALVTGVAFDVQTALVATGGSATLDVQVLAASTVENSGVLVNDHAEANLSLGFKVATVVPQKLSATSPVYLTAGTAAFDTAGKMRVFVKYYMAKD